MLFLIKKKVNNLKERVLKALKNSKTEFISGEKLSEELGVSRTTVWKNIKALREEGYKIESYSKRGYKLNESADMISEVEIKPHLKTEFIGREYIHMEEVDSTNEEVKRVQAEHKEGLVIVAEEQTAGKGRLGRNWQSPSRKGIYMSILLKPDIMPQEAYKLTQVAAASVVLAFKSLGLESSVKWPNDIVIYGKKVSGILTEMSGELMSLDYIVVGIGINTGFEKDDMDQEIKSKATSISIEKDEEFSRKELVAEVLNNFEKLYSDFLDSGNIDSSIEICRENSAVIGKEIVIIRKDSKKIRKAVDIDADGALIVEDSEGNTERIVTGEVSIRGLSSYI